jgi:chromosome segregation ATPase
MQRTALTLALAALVACAGSRSHENEAPKVSDADFARLGPGQMAPVDQARQAVNAARDELARARLRQQQTQNEAALAQADRTAAEADAQRAAAEAKTANDSREPAALQRVQQLQQQASLRRQAADAHLDYANKLSAARAAQVASAQRQVDLAEAQLEWTKLQALQAAGVPAASKYDQAAFQKRYQEARQAADQSFQQSRELETQSIVAQRHYEDVTRQLQAWLGTGRAG